MLKLFAIPVSLYCAKTRILLRHKGLDFAQTPPPGGYGSDEYKSIILGGNLPAMIHDDLMLSDSEAIAEYLNEAFPDPQMLPGSAADRARIRQLSRFHDTRLEPALRRLFDQITREFDTGFVTEAWAEMSARVQQIDPLLPANTHMLTLADCGLPITCTWITKLAGFFDQPNPITPALGSYLNAVQSHAAVAGELAEYDPLLDAWLAEK